MSSLTLEKLENEDGSLFVAQYILGLNGDVLCCNANTLKVFFISDKTLSPSNALKKYLDSKEGNELREAHKVSLTSKKILQTHLNMGQEISSYHCIISPMYNEEKVIGTSCILTKGEACYRTGIADEKSNFLSLLKRISEIIPANVFWLDSEYKVIGANASTLSAIGAEKEDEVINKTVHELYPQEIADKIIRHYIDAREQNKTLRHQEIIVDIKTGEPKYFYTVKSPVRDDEGNIICVLGISLDITEQKLLEEELIAAKEQAQSANKAKTAFLANMSHDIRTPLTGVLNICEVMKDDMRLRTSENISDVYDASKNLLQMLNQILDYTKAESIDFRKMQKDEVFPIRDVINNILELYRPSAKAKALKLDVEILENVPHYLKTKPTFIHKILVNLVGNALKFTNDGYVKIKVWYDKINSHLYLSVIDTGQGIPDEKKEVVFDWFEKIAPSYIGTQHGTGLGLAVVKSAIEALGAVIAVTDNEAGGTIFTCEIPVEMADSEANVASKNAFAIQNKAASKSIDMTAKNKRKTSSVKANNDASLLLIEDDATAGKGALLLLNKAGFSVNWVDTGKEGLSEILSGKYSYVISDIGLPDIAGNEIIKQARDKGLFIPIYALTGHAEVDREHLISEGFTDVMVKPLNMNIFFQLISGHASQAKQFSQQLDNSVIDLSLKEQFEYEDEDVIMLIYELIKYIDSEKENIAEIVEACDVRQLCDLLHKLKGGTAYTCTPKIGQVLEFVHKQLKSDSFIVSPKNLTHLVTLIFDAVEELKAELQKNTIDLHKQ